MKIKGLGTIIQADSDRAIIPPDMEIPEDQRYKPSAPTQDSIVSKGQPTIFGTQHLQSNVEELRAKYNK